VVEDDRVAVIVRVAEVPEAALRHEGVEGERGFLEAVRLTEDADGGVDGLDVVIRAGVGIGVRRAAGAPVEAVQTFEYVEWRRRRLALSRLAIEGLFDRRHRFFLLLVLRALRLGEAD